MSQNHPRGIENDTARSFPIKHIGNRFLIQSNSVISGVKCLWNCIIINADKYYKQTSVYLKGSPKLRSESKDKIEALFKLGIFMDIYSYKII